MNQVSDLNLAVAVSDAGAMPCISSHCYRNPGIQQVNPDLLDEVLTEFSKQTGTNNCMLAVEATDPLVDGFEELIKKHKVTWIELFPGNTKDQVITDEMWATIKHALVKLSYESGLKVLLRWGGIPVAKNGKFWIPRKCYFDALSLKGNDSAGRTGSSEHTTKEIFDHHRAVAGPDAPLVPMGGIGNPLQVKEYLDNGAAAVAVGTLFAAAVESPLTTEAKQQMVSKTKNDIQRLTGMREQNAIKLGDLHSNDDSNHTKSLIDGVNGNGQQGILFAGHGIDGVTSIRTVKEVVEYLMGK